MAPRESDWSICRTSEKFTLAPRRSAADWQFGWGSSARSRWDKWLLDSWSPAPDDGYLLAAARAWEFSRADNALAELRELAGPHIAGLKTRAVDVWILLAAATALLLLGLADDWRGLDWRLRLGRAGWARRWPRDRLRQGLAIDAMFVDAPLLTGLVSVVWIVGLVNSFNMLDNMDGLSAGVATIAAALLAAVLLLAPNPVTHGPQLFVAGFLLVLAGSMAGFLVHNRRRLPDCSWAMRAAT